MQYLNQPLVLQGMRLNNRLVMPPMATAKSTAEGAVTQALCEYYRARAEGGFLGLIITEHSYVSAQGKASTGQLSAADDGAVTPLGACRYAECLLAAGAGAALHLYPSGGHGFGLRREFAWREALVGELRMWLDATIGTV